MSKETDFLTLKKVAASFLVFGVVISILLVNALDNKHKIMSKEKMDSYVFLYDVVAFYLDLCCCVLYIIMDLAMVLFEHYLYGR